MFVVGLVIEQIAQKEKTHVVDYHRNSSNPVAARLFRRKYQSQVPEDRRLDSYTDRYCPHPHCFASVGDRVSLYFVEIKKVAKDHSCICNTRKEFSNDLHNRYRSNRIVFDRRPAIKAATNITIL